MPPDPSRAPARCAGVAVLVLQLSYQRLFSWINGTIICAYPSGAAGEDAVDSEGAPCAVDVVGVVGVVDVVDVVDAGHGVLHARGPLAGDAGHEEVVAAPETAPGAA